jgi:hypothetical protein
VSDNHAHVSDPEINEFWSFVGAKKRRRRKAVTLVNIRHTDVA